MKRSKKKLLMHEVTHGRKIGKDIGSECIKGAPPQEMNSQGSGAHLDDWGPFKYPNKVRHGGEKEGKQTTYRRNAKRSREWTFLLAKLLSCKRKRKQLETA